MKKTFALLLMPFLLCTCRKPHTDNTMIKYEFTCDVPAKYQIDYAVSNHSTASLLFNGTSWSQSLGVSNSSQPDSFSVARLTARPPSDWAGTNNRAHITLTIRIDGDEKAKVDTIMTAADADGISESYTF